MKFFGTDGIRGPYGGGVINEFTAYCLGKAIVEFLAQSGVSEGKILLGRDPRSSGESMLKACAGGIEEMGFSALDAGVVPTPCLAYGVRLFGAKMGVMITASHNPETDNGIKLFTHQCSKLSIDREMQIENLLQTRLQCGGSFKSVAGASVDLIDDYLSYVCGFFPKHCLAGMSISIDAANGSTSSTSPEAFSRLGAAVTSVNTGDGIINDQAGSEFPSCVQNFVQAKKADLGVAHDGDGDRSVFVDASGQTIDGDKILGFLAKEALDHGNLGQRGFVGTVQSNSGLEISLKSIGVQFHRSQIGDRNVSFLMTERGCNWGGESSGHILSHDYLATGDGLFAALTVAFACQRNQRSLEEMTEWIRLWPSKCVSLQVEEKVPLDKHPQIQEALARAKSQLGPQGRVVLRYSGTEPKLRLLAEAENEKLMNEVLADIYEVLQKTL